MVMPSYYPVVGGMEIQIERQIPYLRECGVDVTILTRRTAGTTARETRDGTEIRRIAIPGGPGLRSISFTALGTLDIARHRKSIDIIHAHSIMSPTTIAALSGAFLRKPIIVSLHARYEPERLLSKPLGQQRLGVYRQKIERFVSINTDIARLLTEHGVPTSSIESIPNGIDTSAFFPADQAEKSALRSKLGIPEVEVTGIFVGRLQPVKQVDVLLRAWASVDCGKLLVLGDGPQRDVLVQLAQDLGLSERVIFKGMVANVADYLRAADIFILPSSSEGLSVALLEAMSSGLVPIATAVGGNMDLIIDGKNGLLVPPGNVAALRDAITFAMQATDWTARASHSARHLTAATFDLRIVAGQLAELYREVVAGDTR
jgi:glycosyltransferase involved in cell wall biosynthesis